MKSTSTLTKGEAGTLNWVILKYNASVIVTNHLWNRGVLTSIALHRKHTLWTEPMKTALHVVLLVFHVWRLKKQKLGQLYLREERSRVLHLSSLSATTDLLLCSRAGWYSIHRLSLRTHLFSRTITCSPLLSSFERRTTHWSRSKTPITKDFEKWTHLFL